MCQRLIGMPVRLLVTVGVLGFAVLLFGFIWYSARLKNRVDRRTVSPQEVLNTTQALVSKSPDLTNPIGFSNIDQTTVEHWSNRRWRVSGYVDTQPQPGVKVRTLYFAVIQQNEESWKLEDLQLQSMQFSGPRKN
jgi:hypothetical protein